MRIGEVMWPAGLSRAAIFSRIRAGDFSQPAQLFEDGRALGRLHAEVVNRIKSRLRARLKS